MTPQIAFLFGLLVVMVYLFLTEKIPVDLTAFLGLVVLIFAGFVAPDEAFTGFASSAVITMLSIFIVSASLLHTGIADMVGGRIHAWVGGKEVPLIITVMLVGGVLSAFMNNIAAVAVLMPAVASLARTAGLSPSRLFMPLSFGAILGGTTTLVGTPPNILAGAMLDERNMQSFDLFDFAPVGVALLALGVLFMVTIGRRLLPNRETGPSLGASRDLAKVYKLEEMIFSIRIPAGSGPDGSTLEQAKLGETLGILVLAIDRGSNRKLAPRPDFLLRAGDILQVKGSLQDVQQLLRIQGVNIEKVDETKIPPPTGDVAAIRFRIL
jgi:di/tricarboxylate transporter